MMKTEIGTLKDGTTVRIAESSPNSHIALYGISGSGKSTRIKAILDDIVMSGGTVIAFDMNGKDYSLDKNLVNNISAVEDGINMNFLDMSMVENGFESYSNFVSYLVDIFSGTINLGVRQIGALREALEFAIEHKREYSTEMEAITVGLEMQTSDAAKGVYNRLWSILKSGIFRQSNKKIDKGKINVFDFRGINPSAQKYLTEIIMTALWKAIRTRDNDKESISIVLDEFQNLSLKKNSVLMEMLREARSYKTNVILATQSMAALSKEVISAVDQTAVQLYFRQSVSDVRKAAANIEETNAEHWALVLKKLRVGESVVVGNFSIRGKEMPRPIVIKTRNCGNSQKTGCVQLSY